MCHIRQPPPFGQQPPPYGFAGGPPPFGGQGPRQSGPMVRIELPVCYAFVCMVCAGVLLFVFVSVFALVFCVLKFEFTVVEFIGSVMSLRTSFGSWLTDSPLPRRTLSLSFRGIVALLNLPDCFFISCSGSNLRDNHLSSSRGPSSPSSSKADLLSKGALPEEGMCPRWIPSM